MEFELLNLISYDEIIKESQSLTKSKNYIVEELNRRIKAAFDEGFDRGYIQAQSDSNVNYHEQF